MESLESMTKKYVYSVIDQISKKYNIKNVQYNIPDEEKNKGFTDGDQIFFSEFDNYEYLLIAFFHELAHCRLSDKIPFKVFNQNWNNTTKMQYEIQITMVGLNFAQENGIIFSDDAVKWLLNENFNYIKNK